MYLYLQYPAYFRLKSTEGLESLQSLDILDLHGNQIGALTGVSRLKNLRVLNLAANSLKKLPSLEGLGSLEELNAKRNRISKIAPEVILAKRLERLYLSNNELRRYLYFFVRLFLDCATNGSTFFVLTGCILESFVCVRVRCSAKKT